MTTTTPQIGDQVRTMAGDCEVTGKVIHVTPTTDDRAGYVLIRAPGYGLPLQRSLDLIEAILPAAQRTAA